MERNDDLAQIARTYKTRAARSTERLRRLEEEGRAARPVIRGIALHIDGPWCGEDLVDCLALVREQKSERITWPAEHDHALILNEIEYMQSQGSLVGEPGSWQIRNNIVEVAARG